MLDLGVGGCIEMELLYYLIFGIPLLNISIGMGGDGTSFIVNNDITKKYLLMYHQLIEIIYFCLEFIVQ